MKTYKFYNEVPWYVKEAIGFPVNFNNLSVEQETFINELCFRLIRDDIKESLLGIKSELEEVIDYLN
tara:strand:- start:619 stop:819 length:201 start_codon:yes stop_codon:yes gene_type:complete